MHGARYQGPRNRSGLWAIGRRGLSGARRDRRFGSNFSHFFARLSVWASVGHADRLGLQVLLIAFLAVAIAEPTLLGAAERAANTEVALAVDRHVARAHPLGHLERPVHVSAADLTGQPVDRVVGDRDRLVVAVIRR